MVFKDIYLEQKEYYGTEFLQCFVLQEDDLYKLKLTYYFYSSHKKAEEF